MTFFFDKSDSDKPLGYLWSVYDCNMWVVMRNLGWKIKMRNIVRSFSVGVDTNDATTEFDLYLWMNPASQATGPYKSQISK